ncbi:MAG TPA: phosphate-starvation-inducible PsiE family protein [Actinomycetota bacterium]|nr:phosphate-starvation-inducible PsiE family protein [Actinomycetota bacterium]
MPSEGLLREKTENAFGFVEDLLYVLVALALSLAGLVLFGYAIYEFATTITEDPLSSVILALLDTMLLVFIVTEIIHTIRAVLDEKILVSEPFLVVGIVAAIRRLVVVSAEAKDLLGKPTFGDAMLEIGVLTGAVLALGATIFMLRHTEHSEPKPRHEPD